MNKKQSRLVTAKELAELLSVKERTVRSWTSERRIPFVKVGRRAVRYDPQEVFEAFVEKVEPLRTPEV
jgi:excisionase family DNA binding protein